MAAAASADAAAAALARAQGGAPSESAGSHQGSTSSLANQQAALALAAQSSTPSSSYPDAAHAYQPPGIDPNVARNAQLESLFHTAGAAAQEEAPSVGLAHVSQMADFHPVQLGAGIDPVPPLFNVDSVLDGSGGWVDYQRSGGDGPLRMVPARALCINIPASVFAPDARRMTHWCTPANDPCRAVAVATLLGALWTPTLKGWLSGNHEEIARAAAAAENEGSKKAKKLPSSVSRYQYVSKDNTSDTVPMFVCAYEELFDSAKEKVIGIRVWKLVFDATHSDSKLLKHLIDENNAVFCASGSAHKSVDSRKTNYAAEHGKLLQLIGGTSLADAKLEHSAAMQYARITSEGVLMSILPLYAGSTDLSDGRPSVPNMIFPQGTLNTRVCGAPPESGMGGESPLSPEYLFNSKRPCALTAGLVELDGTLMDVHSDQMDVASYFDPVTHEFRCPAWVAEKESLSFQTDPSKLSIFEMPMPRPIAGVVTPGIELLRIFRDRFAVGTDLTDPTLLDLFTHTMSGVDQSVERTVQMFAESITTFDTAGCSNDQRVAMNKARSILSSRGGVRSYGGTDENTFIIEPRQALKDIALDSSQVYGRIIVPWVKEERELRRVAENKLRAAAYEQGTGAQLASSAEFKALLEEKDAFDKRFAAVQRDLAEMHLRRMERSFNSRMDADSIPAGWRAAWSGLQTELETLPNKSANIAFGLGFEKTDSDRTVFGYMTNWLGSFFEDECFSACAAQPRMHATPRRVLLRLLTPRVRLRSRRPRLAHHAGALLPLL